MTAEASLEAIARARFVRDWAELGPGQAGLDGAAPRWLTHDLVHMLARAPHRSVDDLAPYVQRLIVEHSFVDENGDSIIAADWDAQVQRQVQRIVAVLERVREGMCREGHWSDVPVTPLMCG